MKLALQTVVFSETSHDYEPLRVARLLDSPMEAGRFKYEFRATADRGYAFSSAVPCY
jgi:hypothetical protein